MKVSDLIRLHVRALAFGGDALGEAPDGRVVFFAGGVPGDEVEVRLEEVKARFARGALVRVIAPGEARVMPRCPLVGRCGGCQWQEVSLAAQRAAKQAIVERALGRLGTEVQPIVTPTADFGYRSRARMRVGANGAIGFQARRSHAVVDVPSCPLLEPALGEAFAEARRLGDKLPAGASIAALVGRGGALQLAVSGLADVGTAATSLVGRAGISSVRAAMTDSGVAGDETIDMGDEGEPPFRAAADGFAQAAREGNRALRARVAATIGGPHTRALELHAGDGNFTRDLARSVGEVIAVEGERRAAARLPGNVTGPGQVTVRAEAAEVAAAALAKARERFDVVLLDPPRAGAAEVVPHLAALAPRVVYVSCDPMTLARDAAALARAGLRPVRATPIDLMPHTYHVETVCLFERG